MKSTGPNFEFEFKLQKEQIWEGTNLGNRKQFRNSTPPQTPDIHLMVKFERGDFAKTGIHGHNKHVIFNKRRTLCLELTCIFYMPIVPLLKHWK